MKAQALLGLLACWLAAAAPAWPQAVGEKETKGLTDYTESPIKASIAGRVQFPKGFMPAEPVRVRLETHTGGILDQIVAGTDGRFQFNHVACGFYVLAVDVAGYRPVRLPVEHSFIPAEGLVLSLVSGEGSAAQAAAIPPKALREHQRGVESLAKKDEAKSITSFEKAIELCPLFDDAYSDLALVHLQRKDLPAARQVLERALAKNSDNLRALVLLGRTARLQGEYPRAVDVLGRALVHKEASWVARLEMGEALVALNRMEEASLHIARAHELNPGLPSIHQLHYNTLIRRSQYRAALAELDEFLSLFPEHSLALKARQQRAALAQKVASEPSPAVAASANPKN